MALLDAAQEFGRTVAKAGLDTATRYFTAEQNKQAAAADTAVKPATPATVAQRDMAMPDWLKWSAIAAAIIAGLLIFKKFLR